MMHEIRQGSVNRVSVVLIFGAMLGSCCDQTPSKSLNSDIVIIANSFVVDEFKDDPSIYNIKIHDDGETWIVSYRSRPGASEGGPLVQIDKQTGMIVGAYAGGQ